MILNFKKRLFSFSSPDETIVHRNRDVEGGQDNSPAAAGAPSPSDDVGNATAPTPTPTWMSLVMNNKDKMVTLATVAALAMSATALAGIIGNMNARTANQMQMSTSAKASECSERRLHDDDAKPRHAAVATAAAAAVPTLEGRKLVKTCSVTISPPDVSSDLQVCNSATVSNNDNVLQAAINAANPGDVICMAPGKYYTGCVTRVNKALTIQGACAGVAFTTGSDSFNPTLGPRPGCTASGETVWVAGDQKGDSNGALQGIFVDVENVAIDGISFYEESASFRRTVGVLCDAPIGTYENIAVLNNYMKGEKISASCPIGGNGNALFPKTINNLEYSGNFVMATGAVNTYSNWEPLGFRGLGFNEIADATPTLNNLKIVNNVIACAKGPSDSPCQVIVFNKSFLTGDSIVAGNNYYTNTNNVCPIETSSPKFDTSYGGFIYGGWDNNNAGVCEIYGSAAPSTAPSVSAAPSTAPSVSAAPSTAPSVSAAPRSQPSTAPSVSAAPSTAPSKSGKKSRKCSKTKTRP